MSVLADEPPEFLHSLAMRIQFENDEAERRAKSRR